MSGERSRLRPRARPPGRWLRCRPEGVLMQGLIAFIAMLPLVVGGYVAGQAGARRGGDDSTTLPGFSRVVSLSHTNSPDGRRCSPATGVHAHHGGDRRGRRLLYAGRARGGHTGTHYSAPCHFRGGRRAPRISMPPTSCAGGGRRRADRGRRRRRSRRHEGRPAGLGNRARGDARAPRAPSGRGATVLGPELARDRAHLLQLRAGGLGSISPVSRRPPCGG